MTSFPNQTAYDLLPLTTLSWLYVSKREKDSTKTHDTQYASRNSCNQSAILRWGTRTRLPYLVTPPPVLVLLFWPEEPSPDPDEPVPTPAGTPLCVSVAALYDEVPEDEDRVAVALLEF